jgi:hypothetical protein
MSRCRWRLLCPVDAASTYVTKLADTTPHWAAARI